MFACDRGVVTVVFVFVLMDICMAVGVMGGTRGNRLGLAVSGRFMRFGFSTVFIKLVR